ncbi:ABC transporter permease [Bacillus sp. Marseille-P3661]|uniref:ABC transporter permease n=1 Tax=Bacillus sp. Marseille-P3661 TaxID=1936234 RepID=UPI000C827405|nr:ABC transporter permease [Bacillus sp. Marseille-P3661]
MSLSSNIKTDKPSGKIRYNYLDYSTIFKQNLVYFALIGIVIFFWIIAGPQFMTLQNWTLILQQLPVLAIIAIGATFVITGGYIDLSIGSLLGISSILGAMSVQLFGPIGLLGGVLTGIVLGLLNGFLFSYLKIPSFIATLGTMVIYRAVIAVISDGQAVYLNVSGNQNNWLQTMGSFPYVCFILIFIVFISWAFYNKSVYGNDLKAMGGNEKVVQLMGVNVKKYKVLTFGITGLLVGIASVINLSQMGAATPVTGQLMELDAIAAVVIGGTALSGGNGSVVKSVVGALTLIVLATGLTIAGVPPSWNEIIRGVLLISAVAIALDRKKIGTVK